MAVYKYVALAIYICNTCCEIILTGLFILFYFSLKDLQNILTAYFREVLMHQIMIVQSFCYYSKLTISLCISSRYLNRR